jgi:hypothetical protein
LRLFGLLCFLVSGKLALLDLLFAMIVFLLNEMLRGSVAQKRHFNINGFWLSGIAEWDLMKNQE